MDIVNLVDFNHIRREWTDPTASSTQDTPGSIDIEWIPDGGSGFPGLSVRGLDDEDIYDTPCSSRVSGPLFDGERTLDDSMPRRTYYPGKKDHHKRVTTERSHPTGGSCPREGHGTGKLIRILFSVYSGEFRG